MNPIEYIANLPAWLHSLIIIILIFMAWLIWKTEKEY